MWSISSTIDKTEQNRTFSFWVVSIVQSYYIHAVEESYQSTVIIANIYYSFHDSYGGNKYILSYRIVSYRIVPCRIVPYRIVSYLIKSYRIVSYRTVSYRIVSYRIVFVIETHLFVCIVIKRKSTHTHVSYQQKVIRLWEEPMSMTVNSHWMETEPVISQLWGLFSCSKIQKDAWTFHTFVWNKPSIFCVYSI